MKNSYLRIFLIMGLIVQFAKANSLKQQARLNDLFIKTDTIIKYKMGTALTVNALNYYINIIKERASQGDLTLADQENLEDTLDKAIKIHEIMQELLEAINDKIEVLQEAIMYCVIDIRGVDEDSDIDDLAWIIEAIEEECTEGIQSTKNFLNIIQD